MSSKKISATQNTAIDTIAQYLAFESLGKDIFDKSGSSGYAKHVVESTFTPKQKEMVSLFKKKVKRHYKSHAHKLCEAFETELKKTQKGDSDE